MTIYTDFKTGKQLNAKNKREAQKKFGVTHIYSRNFIGVKGYKDEQNDYFLNINEVCP